MSSPANKWPTTWMMERETLDRDTRAIGWDEQFVPGRCLSSRRRNEAGYYSLVLWGHWFILAHSNSEFIHWLWRCFDRRLQRTDLWDWTRTRLRTVPYDRGGKTLGLTQQQNLFAPLLLGTKKTRFHRQLWSSRSNGFWFSKATNKWLGPLRIDNYLNEGIGNPWPGQASDKLCRAVRSKRTSFESVAKRGRALLTGSIMNEHTQDNAISKGRWGMFLYLVTGTGWPWAAHDSSREDELKCINEVLVAAVEKRGLTLPLGSLCFVITIRLNGRGRKKGDLAFTWRLAPGNPERDRTRTERPLWNAPSCRPSNRWRSADVNCSWVLLVWHHSPTAHIESRRRSWEKGIDEIWSSTWTREQDGPVPDTKATKERGQVVDCDHLARRRIAAGNRLPALYTCTQASRKHAIQ